MEKYTVQQLLDMKYSTITWSDWEKLQKNENVTHVQYHGNIQGYRHCTFLVWNDRKYLERVQVFVDDEE